ncbi:hypothetical protein PF005_g21260 [Phytophthora fragariae]|nr:hypothetical protein PF003_g22711 [Phytophthora fragariae]KAE9341882.1 hypothetical protein PR003_g9760 [Phytophthora rubi]KAE8927678.1 hypothetical protein PF009_g22165 [Phytophthora fragariae]KAE8985967.1 hypothetical protein PF011_g20181 [Phytophthora fragariae]KAE9085421.1 hypothetical protein PF007_g21152 [Phytophthora fragariae]
MTVVAVIALSTSAISSTGRPCFLRSCYNWWRCMVELAKPAGCSSGISSVASSPSLLLLSTDDCPSRSRL